jgi:hypothetical protein
VGPPDADTFPWERRRELGVVRAFVQNLTMSVREPGRFYGLAAGEASHWPAVAYGFVFELAVALATFAYTKLFGEAELHAALGPFYPQLEQMFPGGPARLDGVMSGAAVVSLLSAPLTYVLELYTMALVTWIGLRLARGLRTSFGHIVRLLAYAGWIRLVGLLDVSGDLVLSLVSGLITLGYASYIWVVLVRSSQQIDTRRALLSSVYGTLVTLAFGCLCIAPPAVVLLAWLVTKLSAF